MAQTKHKKKKKKKTKKQPYTVVLILVVLLLLGFLGLFLIMAAPQTPEAPVPSPSSTLPPVSAAPTLPPSTLEAQYFGMENGYKTYETESFSALLGLDVSSHQGWIDWETVAESGVDYVILRAGYRGYGSGSVHPDDYFEYNITSAAAAGLDVGIYFFSQALTPEEAADEARTVLGMIEGYEVDYPIFFDWEPITDDEARTATISATEVTACAKSFCQVIEDAGYEAGVYFNLSIASSYYHLYDLKDYEFWLAEYADTPSFPFYINMWQYTSEGTVPGIGTNVDLNLSFKAYGS